jgi:plastocyanin
MNRYRTMAPAAILAAGVLMLGACSPTGTATDGQEPVSAAPSVAASVAASAAASPAAATDTVAISGSSFGDDITVPVGTTVTFTNNDTVDHTVTEGTDGQAADGARYDEEVPAGESVEITFDEAGTVDITCKIHPTMSLVVTVEG